MAIAILVGCDISLSDTREVSVNMPFETTAAS
jgi:hypothetical protein